MTLNAPSEQLAMAIDSAIAAATKIQNSSATISATTAVAVQDGHGAEEAAGR